MGARRTCLIVLGAAIAITIFHNAADVWATPSVGFTTTTVLQGTLGEIDVSSRSLIPDSSEYDRRAKDWLALQNARGSPHLYVQSNVWQPGGSTGWHTHPGRSLIIVRAGTVTEYDGSDPDCKPHVYTKDMTFVDHGGHHVHMIRNEGDGIAQTTALQLIPAGAARRIDIPDPGHCRF